MEYTLQPADKPIIALAVAAVLLPLLAFAINMLLRGRENKAAGWISAFAILTGSACSVFVFAKVWNGAPIHAQFNWFTIGSTKVAAGILLNNLSALMLLLVNLIALPVHIYSVAYMAHDEHYKRYFAYLSFFSFSMLALVVADNLVLFYVFWELVGFSSYLLIGFWFTREKAVQANKKAFIMNRIGDVGLLTAIIILFTQFGTFDIVKLFGADGMVAKAVFSNGLWVTASGHLPEAWQYIAFAGILLAVAAKSAQFPLHTWLPDAMEGPTSVSALIHAATMVAAGVFLLGRVYPLFNGTELTVLSIVGCFTAFMAATIALAQNDLKRILAYSTISQLGYMVMAMGVGAYASSFMHLAAHAFFKCLLFLAAGIVIHKMAHIRDENKLDFDPQNIQYMGGLRKKLPVTFIATIIAGAALVGLPLTSGFLSKDGILISAFEWSADKNAILQLIPVFAVLTTWLTAFYITRLIVKVFFGDLRIAEIIPGINTSTPQENSLYKLPLIFLAVCSLFPLFSLNPFNYQQSWLMAGLNAVAAENIYHALVPGIATVLSIAVIYWVWLIYSRRKANPFPQRGFIFNLVCNEWYFDAIYNKVIVKPVIVISRSVFWIDRRIIDGFINLLAKSSMALSKTAAWADLYIIDGFIRQLVALVRAIGNFARRFQGGKVQYYLFSMLAVILALFILKTLF